MELYPKPLTDKQYLDLREKIKILRTKNRRKLTSDEKYAVDAYTGSLKSPVGQAYKINEPLYDKTKTYEQHPDIKTKFVPHEKLVESLDNALKKSTIYYNKRLYRGINDDKFIHKYKLGDTITFSSYLSTSYVPAKALVSYAGLECCMIVFDNNKYPVLFGPIEDEIILPRETTWKLAKIKEIELTKNSSVYIYPIHGNFWEYSGRPDKHKMKIYFMESNS
jgi:hypothetical protein